MRSGNDGGLESPDLGKISAPFWGLLLTCGALGLVAEGLEGLGVRPPVAPGVSGIKFHFRSCSKLSLGAGGRIWCPGELEMSLHVLTCAQGAVPRVYWINSNSVTSPSITAKC